MDMLLLSLGLKERPKVPNEIPASQCSPWKRPPRPEKIYPPEKCGICGIVFVPKGMRRKYCSHECSLKMDAIRSRRQKEQLRKNR